MAGSAGELTRGISPAEIASYRAERKREAEESLASFVRQAWPVLEPNVPLRWNWHLDLICEHLEAMTNGEIQNLVINIPPGFMKSLLAVVFWPSWEWGPRDQPHRRYLCSAYGEALSLRDNERARYLMESRWYQARWGDRVQFDRLVNAKEYYQNKARGSRRATSVGAAGTGMRADTVIFDDPHKLDATGLGELSLAIRHKNRVLSSRGIGNDTRKLLIGQRVATGDVTDDTLRQMDEGGDQYELLIIPARYSPTWRIDYPNGLVVEPHPADPRTERGALIQPEYQGEDYTRNLEIALHEHKWAVMQQNPMDEVNTLFTPGMLRYYYREPTDDGRSERYLLEDPDGARVYARGDCPCIVTVDLATSLSEHADYTVFAAHRMTPAGDLLLTDMLRARIAGPQQLKALEAFVAKHRPMWVGIESVAYQLSFVQAAMQAGLPAHPIKREAGMNKRMRVVPLAILMDNSKYFLPATAAWDVEGFIDRLLSFTGLGGNEPDDEIDAAADAAREASVGVLAGGPVNPAAASRWRPPASGSGGPAALGGGFEIPEYVAHALRGRGAPLPGDGYGPPPGADPNVFR